MAKHRDDESADLEKPGAEMHEWLHGLRKQGPVVEIPFAGSSAWLILGDDPPNARPVTSQIIDLELIAAEKAEAA